MGVPTPQYSASSDGRVMLWHGHEPPVFVDAATARTIIGTGIKGHLYGLTLSTAGASATFGIAAGEASDSTGAALMVLASAYTKTTGAWAVGSGNGALDTGAIANFTWYHVYIIIRLDTRVVDVLLSLSATAPTMPTNYTLSRRIGSLATDGSSKWQKFVQDGDMFMWDALKSDVVATNPGTSAVTRTLSVPTGVRVQALIVVATISTIMSSDSPLAIYISDLSLADSAASITMQSVECYLSAEAGLGAFGSQVDVMTNTSSQIRSRCQASTAGMQLFINTRGWVDRRGRD